MGDEIIQQVIRAKCPKCGTFGDHRFVKSWSIIGRGDINTRIEIFKCLSCRKKWRRGVNLKKEKESEKTKMVGVHERG